MLHLKLFLTLDPESDSNEEASDYFWWDVFDSGRRRARVLYSTVLYMYSTSTVCNTSVHTLYRRMYIYMYVVQYLWSPILCACMYSTVFYIHDLTYRIGQACYLVVVVVIGRHWVVLWVTNIVTLRPELLHLVIILWKNGTLNCRQC